MTKKTEPWYEVIEASTPLTQGDLIAECPLLRWNPIQEFDPLSPDESKTLMDSIETIKIDAVVLTQACDLEHNKVHNVVVCRHVPLSLYQKTWEDTMQKAGQNPTAKGWKRFCDDVAGGHVWNQSFLNRVSLTGEETDTDVRIVDFHEIFTVPRSFVESILRRRNKSRIRLLPPYREHLSQAFARFFMRVGLPAPIEKTW